MHYHDIKNYLEGKTSREESEKVLFWLKNPKNENESRRILGEIWFNSDIQLNSSGPDFDQMLNQLHQQINSQKIAESASESKPANVTAGLFNTFSKVAAILIIPLFLVTVYVYYNPQQTTTTVATTTTIREVYTKPGTRTKIELSDGTLVWLNDGTTFRYPEQFYGDQREVFVDGEAYFEVKSDEKHPFIVDNKMMKTVVTGTHFNLNAYSSDHFFEATLLKGKVRLEKNNQSFTMKPGVQVQFDAELEKFEAKNVNPQNAAAWINGKLIFKDERLGTAIKKLGRWYNVDIVLSNSELNEYLLTGTIQDEKLDQTMNLISLALPVTFKFKKKNSPTEIQRTIYLMKK